MAGVPGGHGLSVWPLREPFWFSCSGPQPSHGRRATYPVRRGARLCRGITRASRTKNS